MSELAHIEKVLYLQSLELFSYCRAEEVLRLASISEERQVQAGESLYEPGEPSDALYCVVRGRIDLESEDGSRSKLGPLTTFGATDIFSGRLRTEEAAAGEDSLLLELDAEDLFDLLANNIEIVKAIFRHLIQELEEERALSERMAREETELDRAD